MDALTGAIIARSDWVVEEPSAQTSFAGVEQGATPFMEYTDDAHLGGSPAAAPAKPAAPRTPDSYDVFPIPAESPSETARTVVNNPADGMASPFGWHDTNGAAGPEFTVTRGNNVEAYTDITAPDGNDPTEVQPDGGPALNFTAPLDFTQSPENYKAASVINLFYMNNIMHDVLYHYGFDEAGGNFQFNTYGRGGTGGDDVRAESQDFSGSNNANFGTPADGQRPRMQMYRWTGAGPSLLTINTPPAIAGDYGVGAASFGPQSFDITGTLALATDSGGASTGDACEAIVANVTGKIAVADRGSCNFNVKAANVQAAGAIGLIIVNNQPGSISPGGADASITIPVLALTQSSGAPIKQQLANGATVQGRMYRSAANPPDRDSSFDNGVIAHEYGHGVSNRLIGGPSNVACLSGIDEQAGEGWSDLYALMLTATAADTRNTVRPIGTYVSFQPTNGAGIRLYPYTTNMAVNPFTYDSIKSATLAVPHGVGTVWATMVWDMYWNLVDKYGFSPDIYTGTAGNNRALRLVTEGLKYTKCEPTFVDNRDGILAADLALYGGADQCTIWSAFARRGLGYSATAGTSASRTDGTQAFDLPPVCTLNVQPASQSVCAPATATYNVAIGENARAISAGPYTLGVQGVPAGAGVQFTPNPLTAPTTATLTINNTAAATPGTYSLAISASSSPTNTYTTTVGLTLANATPGAATLTSPAEGSVGHPIRPIFTWTPGAQTAQSTVQVATDAAFSTIIVSATSTTGSLRSPISFRAGQTYFWRVLSSNVCGTGLTSSVASFTIGTTHDILLVDNDGNGPDTQAAYTSFLAPGSYDVLDTTAESRQPDATDLQNYRKVIWFGGQFGGGPDADAEPAFATFLNAGGCFAISSQEYFYLRGGVSPFMTTYMGVASAVDDADYTSVTGVSAPFGSIGATTLSFSGTSNHTDAVNPTSDAQVAFVGNPGNVNAGVIKDAGGYRTMYLGFTLDTVPAATRSTIIGAIVDWCAAQPLPTATATNVPPTATATMIPATSTATAAATTAVPTTTTAPSATTVAPTTTRTAAPSATTVAPTTTRTAAPSATTAAPTTTRTAAPSATTAAPTTTRTAAPSATTAAPTATRTTVAATATATPPAGRTFTQYLPLALR